ncbi:MULTISPECIES: 16S rRNA (guanine(527)-N(7))-methyltransferase RsmG [unclassified Rhizobium]|uniref:16S rRNA (guanine(527)-N(7))-methyltransferase RsmG n=1 Tax=unclassified Rhizobium TaxID=2613769 RepID=UPI000714C186|nr:MULTISPECIES: 16S rRNA (guanine(527)-N(7))-methyltransferase RsmG [unclassified Rhizobium]KQS87517.1 16S rRNA (guanine(527)-N(7))-methyltransferase RsmG [Rhizobium sp. Leaf391]KQT06936.1 16S rRNA (guanine(527)-N(7))-methyltransferase RsmG [Rhizobium sp. Leaf386]KQT95079.1 16S rRNA (guanine(527)-N(7))-methyltransferase RsmG [Rhizobium sp. Leaf453]
MIASPSRDLNGLRVSRETSERLEHFATLFQKWAKSINLVAPSTFTDIWKRHIADSAQIYQLFPGPKRWIDLGSGGGFPGVITAIFLAELSEGWVHLVESNNKKAAFLRVALHETGARGSVHPIRIESAHAVIPSCDAISARALADLPLLLEYCASWMTAPGKPPAFFHKGRDYQQEIDKAVGRFQFDLVKHTSVIEPDSVVLEIANLSRKTQ